MDLLPDFFDKPQDIQFEHQEAHEHIEILVRQHWVTNLPWLIFFFLGLFVPAFISIAESSLNINFLSQVPLNIYFGLLIVWYMVLFAFAIESLLHWYFNIYIVTNIHIVDINFYSLLSKQVVQGRLDDIQHVVSQIKGIFGSFFHYGDVTIETAGQGAYMLFAKVPNPDLVADRIQDLQEKQEPKHAN